MVLVFRPLNADGAVRKMASSDRGPSDPDAEPDEGGGLPDGGGVGTRRVFCAVLALSQRRAPPMDQPRRFPR